MNKYCPYGDFLYSSKSRYYQFIIMIWLCYMACGILVPRPELEPAPPVLEAQRVNHWAIREVPVMPSWTFRNL